MRAVAAILAAVALAACGPRAGERADAAATASGTGEGRAALARREPWLLCHALGQPAILVAQPADPSGAIRIEIHPKTAAETTIATLRLGAREGAAGSVYQTLSRDGAEAGYVRALNPGMPEDPNNAYTNPIVRVRIDERDYSCAGSPRASPDSRAGAAFSFRKRTTAIATKSLPRIQEKAARTARRGGVAERATDRIPDRAGIRRQTRRSVR